MPRRIKCPNCGAPLILLRNGREAKCEYCDSEFEIETDEEEMEPDRPTESYEYGHTRAVSSTKPSPKSKKVCMALCICFGWLGIHQFYVGKIGWGIAYMFSYGLFFIGWIGDISKIAKGEFTDSEGCPVCLDYGAPTL